MNFTALASAVSSRFLEMASWTSMTTIGARIANTIPITMKIIWALLSRSLFPEREDQKRLLRKISEMMAIIPTRTAVRVMNLMS